MKFNNLIEAAKSVVSKTSFKIKKFSPEIFLVGGIVATGASVVLACIATKKLDKVMEKSNKEIDDIHAKIEDEQYCQENEYTEKEYKKELTKAYVKAGWSLTKLYAPTVIAFGLGITSILNSHRIMKGRQVALAAAYASLTRGFQEYRKRVSEKYGEEAEKDIYLNLEEKTDENGNKVKVPRINGASSDYTLLFDECNPNYIRNPRNNFEFIIGIQKFLNKKLKCEHYVFLWDALKSLGFDASCINEDLLLASRVVGWIYDPDDPNHCGDNYINFGLSDEMGNPNKFAMESIRCNNPAFWLEFNVDGDILTGEHGKKRFIKYAQG